MPEDRALMLTSAIHVEGGEGSFELMWVNAQVDAWLTKANALVETKLEA